MLKTLEIENIAVIEKTSVDFSRGLNVLTGETGAGKSIVVDSINAILGERTSRELVRHGADNAYVSACFEDIDDSVCKVLDKLGFDAEDDGTLILSRKISSTGKSSCRVNGKSATVSMLREIGSSLVNIHGQHDNQELLNPDYQYKFIDMLFDDNSILNEYKTSFKKLISVRRKLKALTSDETDKERKLELLDYQINELEQADIKVGERDKLNARRELINKSEAVSQALGRTLSAISGDDDTMGIQSGVNDCYNSLCVFDEAKGISEILADINDKLEAVKDGIDKLYNEIDFDPGELEKIEERLDLLYRFSNKYGATEEEMLDFLDKAREARNSIVYSDQELEKLNEEYDRLFDDTLKLADKLSQKRKSTAEIFEKQVKSELEFLDMPKLEFVVDFQKGIFRQATIK